MKAVLFGSIGVLAQTSELQRRAYNTAFARHGLDWHWNIATYCRLLATAGGQRRIRTLAGGALSEMKIRQIHETKQDVFAELLADGVLPRPGIIETISRARHAGLRLGFVTTTTPRTLDMIRDAMASHIDFAEFAVTTSKADVAMEKPDGEAYETALQRLGLLPSEAIAFEDTVASQSSAHAAGLRCHLYAGEYAHVGVAPLQTRDPAAALAADLDAAMMIESDKLMTRTVG
ncbi:MAG: HAD-IA family hydrolase [Candidatus Puniceispirillaceae bacterium]